MVFRSFKPISTDVAAGIFHLYCLVALSAAIDSDTDPIISGSVWQWTSFVDLSLSRELPSVTPRLGSLRY